MAVLSAVYFKIPGAKNNLRYKRKANLIGFISKSI